MTANTPQQPDAGRPSDKAGPTRPTPRTMMDTQPVRLDTDRTIRLGTVVLESPGTSTLTVRGEVRTTQAPGFPCVAWADVRIEDADFEPDGSIQPDARQARMMAAYFLNLADLMDSETAA